MAKVSQNYKDFLLTPTNSELDELKSEVMHNVRLSFNGLANATFKFVQFINGTTKSMFVVVSIDNFISRQATNKIFLILYCLKFYPLFLRILSTMSTTCLFRQNIPI